MTNSEGPLDASPARAHPPPGAGSSTVGVGPGGVPGGAAPRSASGPDGPPPTVEGAVVSTSAVPPNAPRLIRPPFGDGSAPTSSAGSPNRSTAGRSWGGDRDPEGRRRSRRAQGPRSRSSLRPNRSGCRTGRRSSCPTARRLHSQRDAVAGHQAVFQLDRSGDLQGGRVPDQGRVRNLGRTGRSHDDAVHAAVARDEVAEVNPDRAGGDLNTAVRTHHRHAVEAGGGAVQGDAQRKPGRVEQRAAGSGARSDTRAPTLSVSARV